MKMVYFTNDTANNLPVCATSIYWRLKGIIAFER